MAQPHYIYADIPMFGRVFDCGDCGCIHLQVGPVSLALTPDAYMRLVDLINQSAASFETRVQERLDPRAQAPEEERWEGQS